MNAYRWEHYKALRRKGHPISWARELALMRSRPPGDDKIRAYVTGLPDKDIERFDADLHNHIAELVGAGYDAPTIYALGHDQLLDARIVCDQVYRARRLA
jgi:hypothetical protein